MSTLTFDVSHVQYNACIENTIYLGCLILLNYKIIKIIIQQPAHSLTQILTSLVISKCDVTGSYQ